MLRHLVYFAAVVIFFYAWEKSGANGRANENSFRVRKLDTSNYVVMKYDTADTWLFRNAKPADLSESELLTIDSFLDTFIINYNQSQRKVFPTVKKMYPEEQRDLADVLVQNFSQYKKQYIPVTNAKGEKEVWINCFCEAAGINWKHEMVMVMDGGTCYFSLILKLSSKSVYRFMVNGNA